jgi:predicted nucleotidyltransferase component of viral defense system
MDSQFFFSELYPFQDLILRIINAQNTDFYLTGGTAASRAYLQHRFSEDLDLFVNDDDRFTNWADRIVEALANQSTWKTAILRRDERFLRLTVSSGAVLLRVELINDVPAHIGAITDHPVLGRIDSPENILANKVTAAIDRDEPKDVADIWGLCTKKGLSLKTALEDAHSKAAGLFPADLARTLCTITAGDWEVVRWIEAPPVDQFISDLRKLGEELIL